MIHRVSYLTAYVVVTYTCLYYPTTMAEQWPTHRTHALRFLDTRQAYTQRAVSLYTSDCSSFLLPPPFPATGGSHHAASESPGTDVNFLSSGKSLNIGYRHVYSPKWLLQGNLGMNHWFLWHPIFGWQDQFHLLPRDTKRNGDVISVPANGAKTLLTWPLHEERVLSSRKIIRNPNCIKLQNSQAVTQTTVSFGAFGARQVQQLEEVSCGKTNQLM